MYFNTHHIKLPLGSRVKLRKPHALPDAPEAIWRVEGVLGGAHPNAYVQIVLEAGEGRFRITQYKTVRWDQIQQNV